MLICTYQVYRPPESNLYPKNTQQIQCVHLAVVIVRPFQDIITLCYVALILLWASSGGKITAIISSHHAGFATQVACSFLIGWKMSPGVWPPSSCMESWWHEAVLLAEFDFSTETYLLFFYFWIYRHHCQRLS